MTSVVAVVVAYGDTPLLARCVTALTGSHDVEVEVVVVDNGAAPEAIADVAALPSVRVVASPANVGFGAGCNLGVAASASTFVAFVNPDVVVERGAMAALAAALADDSVGIATASVRLLDEPGLLNSAGGAVHFLGIGWADAFRAPATSRPSDRDVMAASGAAMAMRRGVFDELGGFTPEFFLYHEDAELSVRCRLRGWRVRYVAGAVVHHHYEFSRNPGKLYYLERNRLCIVLACYSWRTLLLLLPALLALEVGMVALAFAQGWGREKLRGWRWLVGHARWLGAHRRRVQSGRRVGDRDLAPLFAPRFTAGQVDLPRWLRPADAALALYWRAVSRLV
jgi:GT2 family glycosyltransferase